MEWSMCTSPFANQFDMEPWVLWEKRSTVLGLSENFHEDVLEACDDRIPIPTNNTFQDAPVANVIKRNQYDSVINRMKKAVRQAGAYSAWTQ